MTSFKAQFQASVRNLHDDLGDKDASLIRTKKFQAETFVDMLELDRDLAMDVMTTYGEDSGGGHLPFIWSTDIEGLSTHSFHQKWSSVSPSNEGLLHHSSADKV